MKLKNLWLPTEDNNYTPHFLQKLAVALMAVLIVLSFAIANFQAIFWLNSNWLVGTVLPAVIVDLTNDERAELAETPLKRSTLLDEAATLKAEDMAKNNYFAHYSPDNVSPWHWFEEVNYEYAHAGENLAIHFSDSGEVVEAWMNSPLHRDNIINNDYLEIGVGTAKGTFEGHETVFVVQLFGTPASPLQPQPPITTALTEPINEEIVPLLPEEASLLEVVVQATSTVIGDNQSTTTTTSTSEDETVPGVVEGESVVAEAEDKRVLLRPNVEDISQSKTILDETPTSETAVVSKVSENNPLTYSFIATSSGLLPASVESVSGSTASQVSALGTLATKPNTLLQIAYLLIGLLLVSILLMSIVLGAKHHRPMQVVYGLGLLLLMSGLFYLHTEITAGVVVAERPTLYQTQG